MKKYVYHVVTDRPMQIGQHIVFDEENHSGVYDRVMSKRYIANKIYEYPNKYHVEKLEHHTRVAIRELALEKIRKKVAGNIFSGDANNCFDASAYENENLMLAERYWQNLPNLQGEPPIKEILVNGVSFSYITSAAIKICYDIFN